MRRIAIALALIGSLQAVRAAPPRTPADELPRFICSLECIAYVANDELPIYATPDQAGREIYRVVGKGSAVWVLHHRDRRNTRDWIGVVAQTPDGRSRVLAWARRQDVVSWSDFRLVSGCWPVTSLPLLELSLGRSHRYEWATQLVHLALSIEGRVMDRGVMLRGDRAVPLDRGRNPMNLRVYYSKGLFKVLQPGSAEDLLSEFIPYNPDKGVEPASRVTGSFTPDGMQVHLRRDDGSIMQELEVRELPAACAGKPITRALR